jgi:hypothetical protein
VKSNSDLHSNVTSVDGSALAGDGNAIPCGLAAKWFFNDEFQIFDGATQIGIDGSDVALFSFPNRFNNINGDWQKLQHVDLENERSMVWFQGDVYPNFDRLWGKLEGKLEKGKTYTLKVKDVFGLESFDLKKSVVIQDRSFFGGREPALGIMFLIAGIFCTFAAILMVGL